jgi:hypothetical protein
MTNDYRAIEPCERRLIDRLLSVPFPGRDGIARQLADAKVRTLDADGCLGFQIAECDPAYDVKYAVPTEGECEDTDGVLLHILLHVRENRVQELELFREDNTIVRSWPIAEKVRVFAPA